MSEYESLSKKELVKIIHALLKTNLDKGPCHEGLPPIEYLFQYYTKRGYFFTVYAEVEYISRKYISATKEEPRTTRSIYSADEITEELVPKFLECIGDIIKQDE